MLNSLWSVVLAAGNGRRLAPVTQGTPKQFWNPLGGRSLLEETLDRIAPLAPPTRTTVVVDRTHECYVSSARRPLLTNWLLYQPQDRGTAAGVLLALTPVLDRRPDAIVLLTPSDHAVRVPDRFRAGVLEAVAAILAGHVDVVLFGVEATQPITDYGWITPGQYSRLVSTRPLRPVAAFVEKPPVDVARRLLAAGAVWNTMVVVARVQAILDLYRTHLPRLLGVFAAYQRLPREQRKDFLTEQYASLTPADFSRDLLSVARGLALYTWPQSIGWSDLGTPDRFERWLAPRLCASHRLGAGSAAS